MGWIRKTIEAWPFSVGLAIFLLIAGPVLLVHGLLDDWVYFSLADGQDYPRFHGGWWGGVVTALLIAYCIVMRSNVVSRIRADMEKATSILGLKDMAEIEATVARKARPIMWLVTLVAILSSIYVVLVMTPDGWETLTFQVFSPEPLFYLVTMTPLMVYFLRAAVTDLMSVAEFRKHVSEERNGLRNIADIDGMKPLAHSSLRVASGWLIIGAIVLLYPINDSALNAWGNAPFVVLVWAQGLLLVMIPRRMIRRELDLFRVRELERLHPLIAQAYAQSEQEPDVTGHFERVGALMAYRHQVETISDRVFDAPEVVKFALVMAIPLGSWFGGALVERLVDVIIG